MSGHKENATMDYIQIAPVGCIGQWCTLGPASDASVWEAVRVEAESLRDEYASQPDEEVLALRLVEMTEAEFEALPDFGGW